jgi:hypothetical protein
MQGDGQPGPYVSNHLSLCLNITSNMAVCDSDYINICLSSSQVSLLKSLVQTTMSEQPFNSEISELWASLQIPCSSEPLSPSPTVNIGQDIVMSDRHGIAEEESDFV